MLNELSIDFVFLYLSLHHCLIPGNDVYFDISSGIFISDVWKIILVIRNVILYVKFECLVLHSILHTSCINTAVRIIMSQPIRIPISGLTLLLYRVKCVVQFVFLLEFSHWTKSERNTRCENWENFPNCVKIFHKNWIKVMKKKNDDCHATLTINKMIKNKFVALLRNHFYSLSI